MINFYDFVRSNPQLLRQYSSGELLFLRIDCGPDFTKEQDWAHNNCFLHVLNGRKRISCRGQVLELDQGSTVFVKKGGITLERMDPTGSCVLLFYIPDAYIRNFVSGNAELFRDHRPEDACREALIPVQATPVIDAFYTSVTPYFTSTENMSPHLVELKFRELLLNLVTSGSNYSLCCYLFRLWQQEGDLMEEIMENNCICNLELHEFARLCHRSLSSFKRDFTAIFGTSPGKWLLGKRLDHAKKLLHQSALPVTEVAMESGFNNLSHFNRVFKQAFGQSPLRYRNQSRKAYLSS